jgi:hypothetical protein
MDMKQILDTLQVTAPAAVATTGPAKKEPTREELLATPYSMSTAVLDKVGLPMEHPSYAKSSCNSCYGRGYIIQTVGGRRYQTCGCVNKGYVRTRKAFEAKVADTLAGYVGSDLDGAKKAVQERYLKEMGF